ncbi:type II toxin-antitoxin system HipA family toxin [Humibacter ginsengiterrae]
MRLAVELYGVRVGTLAGEARTFDFAPSDEGIDVFGVNSAVLSVTMPLTSTLRRDHASRRRNWFAELLPEGDQYDYMLQQGGLRPGDTPGFLARYGRDVAGAVQLWDLDDPAEPKHPNLRELDGKDVRQLLENPLRTPLGNDVTEGKSSLGGVQPKVVLVRTGRGWAQPLDGYPSTHILKPQLAGELSTVIFDEEYGARLARRLRLARYSTAVEKFDGLNALVIERYDRLDGERVHQEDFNQALGASGNQKYQELGGVVSLNRVADLLKRYTPEPDVERLARMVVLSVAIGNLDMHTKNIGLLHPADGAVELAPAYDVVPQRHMANDGRLALAVNGKYRHGEVSAQDLEAEIGSWGVRRATKVVHDTLDELSEVIHTEVPLDGAHPRLHEELMRFVMNLRSGLPTGGAA